MVVVVGLSGLLMTACSDMLEPEVYGDLTPDTFFSSESDFDQAVVALYSPFTSDWGFSDPGDNVWSAALYNADPKSYLGQSMVTTDEMYAPDHAVFNNFTWGPATFTMEGNVFAATYIKSRFIARATDVIEQIETSEADVPQDVRDRYVAQARTLRAWLMFSIYDFHGPVPVKLDPETLHDTEINPRPSQEEYVAAMENDLLAAIPNLEEKYNNDAENWGRVSKGTARMILLRLYMHEKDWPKAEAVARDLMNMGYSLLPNYADVFHAERNNEMIHAIPAGEGAPNYWVAEVVPSNYASGIEGLTQPGWNVYYMPWEFYDKFSEEDERRATIVDSYENSRGTTVSRGNGMQGAIPLKFTQNLTGNPGQGYDFDQPIFRYPEVLLSLAEAIVRQQGVTGEALALVEQVRNRAGLDMEGWAGLSSQQFLDALLEERAREFYGEGLRRMDLIRHGKFIENARARGVSNAQPHHVLFPIPQTVIVQSNGIVEQNPGYN
ncbi:Starch-binding associating with outer membrane [Gracilimonas mengyeensis]|uniref:Starch-binding associating with outer membrane n=2 Tax=Gracilimonas mengyeensis TaxID=1302730 RepID=A0A521BSG1_9BACT|nr:Starch-binding associating with outer membrane [Gracilimonas mengyeensis]